LFLGADAFVDGYLGRAPVGLMVGLSNSGDASAVISTVQVIGAPGYRAPRLLALHTANDIAHYLTVRVRSVKPHLTFRDGPVRDLGSLYGRPVARLTWRWGYMAVAVLSPPPPTGCWAITGFVTHYRVGIRHYAATDPTPFYACGLQASKVTVDAALTAVGGSPG
jgi:hypothetical protein